jgi:hypothetical protein
MAEIININPINPFTFELQEYSVSDSSLITSFNIDTTFNPNIDYLEYFIYDLNGNVLVQNVSGYPGYKLIDNNVVLDPEVDLKAYGYTEGQYNTLYNFLSPKLGSNSFTTYYISEISSDRTEVRLDTTSIPNTLVISSSLELINDITNSTGSYYDFYLDFGNNDLVIAVNALLDTTDPTNPTVLIKLYEPLPSQFDLQSQLWVVTQVSEPIAYNINITQTFDIASNNIQLRGPNTNVSIKNQINNSTDYASYQALSATTAKTGSNSLQYQLNNLLAQTGVSVNVDYSNYSDFIHFSNAQVRLENFYYKLSLIEQYSYSSSLSDNAPANYYTSQSSVIYQSKIDAIITTFDNYEYYLYYNSGSTSWPKSNTAPPYVNVPTTSSAGLTWFASQSAVAEYYDSENNNALTLAIPSYLREDDNNQQYILFVEMVGQLFDEVFVYLQGITDKADNDNRLNYGVSKDLVADVLRDLGIKIYQNNFSSNDLYQALIGMTPSGSLYNLPFTTPTLPVATGSGLQYITSYVTASSTSSLVPTYDVNASVYKRIYNSVPYILKKKGSYAGLRALINLFGVPDTVLRISEFGGQNKINTNDYDYWYNQFNYAFYTSGSNYVTSSFSLNTSWASSNNVPQAVEFRFKTDGLPQNTASIASQSLWETSNNVKLVLKYTGSGYVSGSYSGSVVNPYNQYAKLDFSPDPASPNTSASIYLPFYDGGWWSVLVNKEGTNYTLTAKNKNNIGDDGNFIGFQASSSVVSSATSWNSSTGSYFGVSSSLSGKIFTGSLQEIRYYTNALSQSNFDDYVMNPYAIDGNYINSAPYVLAFRAPLGSDLITGSTTSIHPKITGSWVTTSSFASNSSYYYNSTPAFEQNTEVIFVNEFPAGIKNRISNKIQQQNLVLPYSSSDSNIPNADVLSPFRSVQQQSVLSGSYTKNINYVEIAFSPQNEINDDINEQLGYFNIGEYIGDPRLQSTTAESYPALDALRDAYFEKYSSNYQWFDYIRLIEFFDNSLFKMLQDFIPARSDLAAGIVVKQHVLERNKYPVPQVTLTASLANIASGSTNIPYVVQDQTITASILVGHITGSNGGTMPDLFGQTQSFNYFVNITQSWSGSNLTPAGYVGYVHDSQDEFFNGELSGSVLTVTTGSLGDCNVVLKQVYIDSSYTSLSTDNYVIDYDFDINKTYYITFSLVNLDIVGSGFILYDNKTGSPFTSTILTSNVGVGQTYTQNQYQLNGIISPLTFANTFPLTDLELGDIIVYESFIDQDCEVLYGDVQIPRQSAKYVMVDFDNSFITASNEAAVLGGYAVKAAVPDSYYTSARQINSRYIGKELVVSNLNKWTEGDISYGKSVTVGNPEVNFVYFNNVGSTSPEWGNNISAKTQANVKLIVDASGSVTKPINDAEGINLGTIQQSFVDSGNATLVLDDYDTFGVNLNILNGTWPIFKSGISIAPILYTQTASYDNNGDIIGFGYTGSITFTQGQQGPDPTKNDYQLLTYGINFNSIQPSTLPKKLDFSTPVILGVDANFPTSSDAYSPIGALTNLSSSGYILTFQAHIEASNIYAAIIDYTIQKNGTEVSRIQVNHAATKTGDIYYTDANATTSDLYTVNAVAYRTLAGTAPVVQLNAASYFRVTQYPLPGTGICTDFWSTGSGTPNILLASTASNGLNRYIGSRQQSIERSGFNPISLDFEPQQYDEIRFQGIEDLAYSIINVTSSNGQLQLQLSGNIPNGTNLSYFLLRRYVADPSNIILDLNKPAGASSGGILKPEYVTDELNKNLDTIVQNLKSKGLI